MKVFKKGEIPEGVDFIKAMKKPIEISVSKIEEQFQVETLEGVMTGKSGDWLMIGVNGEMYPCDAEIFEKTYNITKGEK